MCKRYILYVTIVVSITFGITKAKPNGGNWSNYMRSYSQMSSSKSSKIPNDTTGREKRTVLYLVPSEETNETSENNAIGDNSCNEFGPFSNQKGNRCRPASKKMQFPPSFPHHKFWKSDNQESANDNGRIYADQLPSASNHETTINEHYEQKNPYLQVVSAADPKNILKNILQSKYPQQSENIDLLLEKLRDNSQTPYDNVNSENKVSILLERRPKGNSVKTYICYCYEGDCANRKCSTSQSGQQARKKNKSVLNIRMNDHDTDDESDDKTITMNIQDKVPPPPVVQYIVKMDASPKNNVEKIPGFKFTGGPLLNVATLLPAAVKSDVDDRQTSKINIPFASSVNFDQRIFLLNKNLPPYSQVNPDNVEPPYYFQYPYTIPIYGLLGNRIYQTMFSNENNNVDLQKTQIPNGRKKVVCRKKGKDDKTRVVDPIKAVNVDECIKLYGKDLCSQSPAPSLAKKDEFQEASHREQTLESQVAGSSSSTAKKAYKYNGPILQNEETCDDNEESPEKGFEDSMQESHLKDLFELFKATNWKGYLQSGLVTNSQQKLNFNVVPSPVNFEQIRFPGVNYESKVFHPFAIYNQQFIDQPLPNSHESHFKNPFLPNIMSIGKDPEHIKNVPYVKHMIMNPLYKQLYENTWSPMKINRMFLCHTVKGQQKSHNIPESCNDKITPLDIGNRVVDKNNFLNTKIKDKDKKVATVTDLHRESLEDKENSTVKTGSTKTKISNDTSNAKSSLNKEKVISSSNQKPHTSKNFDVAKGVPHDSTKEGETLKSLTVNSKNSHNFSTKKNIAFGERTTSADSKKSKVAENVAKQSFDITKDISSDRSKEGLTLKSLIASTKDSRAFNAAKNATTQEKVFLSKSENKSTQFFNATEHHSKNSNKQNSTSKYLTSKMKDLNSEGRVTVVVPGRLKSQSKTVDHRTTVSKETTKDNIEEAVIPKNTSSKEKNSNISTVKNTSTKEKETSTNSQKSKVYSETLPKHPDVNAKKNVFEADIHSAEEEVHDVSVINKSDLKETIYTTNSESQIETSGEKSVTSSTVDREDEEEEYNVHSLEGSLAGNFHGQKSQTNHESLTLPSKTYKSESKSMDKTRTEQTSKHSKSVTKSVIISKENSNDDLQITSTEVSEEIPETATLESREKLAIISDSAAIKESSTSSSDANHSLKNSGDEVTKVSKGFTKTVLISNLTTMDSIESLVGDKYKDRAQVSTVSNIPCTNYQITTESTMVQQSSPQNISSGKNQTFLKSIINNIINDFVPKESGNVEKKSMSDYMSEMVGSKQIELLPDIIDTPILKRIFLLPQVENMLVDTIKRLLSEISDIANNISTEKLTEDVVRSDLKNFVQKIPILHPSAATKTSDKKWQIDHVTQVSITEVKIPSNFLLSKIHNLVSRPEVGMQAARHPIVRNVIVKTVKHSLTKSHNPEKKRVEEEDIRNALSYLVDQHFGTRLTPRQRESHTDNYDVKTLGVPTTADHVLHESTTVTSLISKITKTRDVQFKQKHTPHATTTKRSTESATVVNPHWESEEEVTTETMLNHDSRKEYKSNVRQKSKIDAAKTSDYDVSTTNVENNSSDYEDVNTDKSFVESKDVTQDSYVDSQASVSDSLDDMQSEISSKQAEDEDSKNENMKALDSEEGMPIKYYSVEDRILNYKKNHQNVIKDEVKVNESDEMVNSDEVVSSTVDIYLHDTESNDKSKSGNNDYEETIEMTANTSDEKSISVMKFTESNVNNESDEAAGSGEDYDTSVTVREFYKSAHDEDYKDNFSDDSIVHNSGDFGIKISTEKTPSSGSPVQSKKDKPASNFRKSKNSEEPEIQSESMDEITRKPSISQDRSRNSNSTKGTRPRVRIVIKKKVINPDKMETSTMVSPHDSDVAESFQSEFERLNGQSNAENTSKESEYIMESSMKTRVQVPSENLNSDEKYSSNNHKKVIKTTVLPSTKTLRNKDYTDISDNEKSLLDVKTRKINREKIENSEEGIDESYPLYDEVPEESDISVTMKYTGFDDKVFTVSHEYSNEDEGTIDYEGIDYTLGGAGSKNLKTSSEDIDEFPKAASIPSPYEINIDTGIKGAASVSSNEYKVQDKDLVGDQSADLERSTESYENLEEPLVASTIDYPSVLKSDFADYEEQSTDVIYKHVEANASEKKVVSETTQTPCKHKHGNVKHREEMDSEVSAGDYSLPVTDGEQYDEEDDTAEDSHSNTNPEDTSSIEQEKKSHSQRIPLKNEKPCSKKDSRNKRVQCRGCKQSSKTEDEKDCDSTLEEIYFVPDKNLAEKSEENKNVISVKLPMIVNKQNPLYIGKLVPKNKMQDVEQLSDLDNTDLFYIGDGVKLPLTIKRQKDGSFTLTLSDKICEYVLNRKCPCCLSRNGSIVRENKNSEISNRKNRQKVSQERVKRSMYDTAYTTKSDDEKENRATDLQTTPFQIFIAKSNLTLEPTRKTTKRSKGSSRHDYYLTSNFTIDDLKSLYASKLDDIHFEKSNNHFHNLLSINNIPEKDRVRIVLTALNNLINVGQREIMAIIDVIKEEHD